MSSNIAISAKDLSKRYDIYARPLDRLLHLFLGSNFRKTRSFTALSNVSFEVEKGETLAIIGRNGAGKSTLLQVLCGILTPSEGQVTINGRVAALLELGAGFNPEFTGRENIYMKAAIYGLDKNAVDELMPDILAFAEIGDFVDQPVKTYSSGMFVRLAFAVIAHLKADILVIDEALAVGDVYFTQKCMRFLREFATHGTLLFVSHDTHTVVNLCKKAIWLDAGKVVGNGDAKTVCDAYLGSFFEDRLNDESLLPEQSDTPVKLKSNEFGLMGASIVSVELLGPDGKSMVIVESSVTVTLVVVCEARETINRPIVGFFVKDRVGQMLIGDNSIQQLPDWQEMSSGQRYKIEFSFRMPHLATGDYTIGVAVGAGTQDQHVQHHWIHDALSFRAQAPPELTGIMVMEALKCTVEKQAAGAAEL